MHESKLVCLIEKQLTARAVQGLLEPPIPRILSPHSSETVLIIATLYVQVYDVNQMASSTFDPNQFKMDQREGWNSVAEGWKKWWQPIEK